MFDWLFTAFDKSSNDLATSNSSALHTLIQRASACSTKDHMLSGVSKMNKTAIKLALCCFEKNHYIPF